MIRHIVFFKLKDFSSEAERNQALDEAMLNFRSLVGEIPQIREYIVEKDIVRGSTSFDFLINSSFDNIEDLKSYQAHPAHQYAVGQNKKWSIQKVVIDYQI